MCLCVCVCVQSLAAAKQADVGPHATTAPLAPVDLSAPHTAATAAALQAVSAAHHTDGSSSSSGADVPVVLATCSAADLTPDNLITPWCEAVAAAGVPRVLLVSDDAGCAAAAKAAGIKTLHHTFQVGALFSCTCQQHKPPAAQAELSNLSDSTSTLAVDRESSSSCHSQSGRLYSRFAPRSPQRLC